MVVAVVAVVAEVAGPRAVAVEEAAPGAHLGAGGECDRRGGSALVVWHFNEMRRQTTDLEHVVRRYNTNRFLLPRVPASTSWA